MGRKRLRPVPSELSSSMSGTTWSNLSEYFLRRRLNSCGSSPIGLLETTSSTKPRSRSCRVGNTSNGLAAHAVGWCFGGGFQIANALIRGAENRIHRTGTPRSIFVTAKDHFKIANVQG
jgi:hypothetical protein